jgi:toluene monooxygenase system protein B
VALFPLVSNFEGDFVLQLVPVDDGDTMDVVAEKAAAHSVGRRVKAQPGRAMRVRLQGAAEPFSPSVTVAQAGLAPMDCVEVYFE